MWWGSVCIYLSNFFPSFLVIWYKVVQNSTFVFLLSSGSISGGFSLVYYSHFLLMVRCPIVVFFDFSRCFLMSFSVSPGQVFRKPCLVSLSRFAVVVLKIASFRFVFVTGHQSVQCVQIVRWCFSNLGQ